MSDNEPLLTMLERELDRIDEQLHEKRGESGGTRTSTDALSPSFPDGLPQSEEGTARELARNARLERRAARRGWKTDPEKAADIVEMLVNDALTAAKPSQRLKAFRAVLSADEAQYRRDHPPAGSTQVTTVEAIESPTVNADPVIAELENRILERQLVLRQLAALKPIAPGQGGEI